MTPRWLRFSVTQLLLLTALIGLVVGLFAASKREIAIRYFQSLSFSPDGRFLAADFSRGGVQVWDLSRREAPSRNLSLPGSPYYYTSEVSAQFLTPTTVAAFRPQYSPTSTGRIVHWDVIKDQQVKSVPLVAPTQPYVQIWCGKQSALVTSRPGTGGSIDMWDVNTGQNTGALNTNVQPTEMSIAPDANRLAVADSTAGTGTSVEVWDTQSKTLVRNLNFPTGSGGIALSEDGERLVVWPRYAAGPVEIRDVNTGERLAALDGLDPLGSEMMTLSPDGNLLASSDYQGILRIWDTRTGKLQGRLSMSTGPLPGRSRFVFSPDGQTVAIGNNGAVLLWDMRTFRTRTLTRSRLVETILLFSTGLIVWAVAWGLVSRRRLTDGGCPSSAATSKPGMSTSKRKLPPQVVGALHPFRTLLPVFVVLAAFSTALSGAMMRVVADHLGLSVNVSFWAVFLAAMIGIPLLIFCVFRLRRSRQHAAGNPFADALRRAREAAGRDGQIVKFGQVTACFFCDSQIQPDLQKTYNATLKRFWEIVGDPYLPKHPLLILVFDQSPEFDAYLKGHLPHEGVYWTFSGREILICERTALDRLVEPKRLLQRLLSNYFLHDYKGFLLQPWLQLLIAQRCNEHASDLPRLHRAVRARLGQEAGATDSGLLTSPPREFIKLLLDNDELANYARTIYYAHQAASLASYLTEVASASGDELLRQFLDDLKIRSNYESVFERHFGCGYSQLLENWRSWSLSQKIEPVDPLPDVLERHLLEHVVPLIQNDDASLAARIRAVRSIGSSVCLSAAGALVEIVRAGISHPLYDDALWSLETLAGAALGNNAADWQAWWDTRPESKMIAAESPTADAAAIGRDAEPTAKETAAGLAASTAHASAEEFSPAITDEEAKYLLAASTPAPSYPPAVGGTGLLRGCRILIGLAAVLSIGWSVAAVMLTPDMFVGEFFITLIRLYGIAAGVYAVAALAAGNPARLKTATTLLIWCFITCNPVTPILAVLAKGLLQHSVVRQRLDATVAKAG